MDRPSVCLLLLVTALMVTIQCQRAEALQAWEPASERPVSIPNTRDGEDSASALSSSVSFLRATGEAPQPQPQSSELTESATESRPRPRHSTRLYSRRRRVIQWPHFDERDFYDVAADISRSNNPAVIRHYAKFIHDNIDELIHDVCRCEHFFLANGAKFLNLIQGKRFLLSPVNFEVRFCERVH